MPIVIVHMYKRAPEVKARIAKRIAQVVAEEGQTKTDGVEVCFFDLTLDGYSKGGEIKSPSNPSVVIKD
jgi:phenylpyruvate tautomerase PptA (4-oxalocrotonate tautomerase family)